MPIELAGSEKRLIQAPESGSELSVEEDQDLAVNAQEVDPRQGFLEVHLFRRVELLQNLAISSFQLLWQAAEVKRDEVYPLVVLQKRADTDVPTSGLCGDIHLETGRRTETHRNL